MGDAVGRQEAKRATAELFLRPAARSRSRCTRLERRPLCNALPNRARLSRSQSTRALPDLLQVHGPSCRPARASRHLPVSVLVLLHRLRKPPPLSQPDPAQLRHPPRNLHALGLERLALAGRPFAAVAAGRDGACAGEDALPGDGWVLEVLEGCGGRGRGAGRVRGGAKERKRRRMERSAPWPTMREYVGCPASLAMWPVQEGSAAQPARACDRASGQLFRDARGRARRRARDAPYVVTRPSGMARTIWGRSRQRRSARGEGCGESAQLPAGGQAAPTRALCGGRSGRGRTE